MTQAKLETQNAKLAGLSAKMDAHYQSILFNLNRADALERDKQSVSA